MTGIWQLTLSGAAHRVAPGATTAAGCMYIYIYIYTHIHMYIYIYIYIYNPPAMSLSW